MLECKYGVVNGQYALKVNKVLAEERIAASGGKDG
jgi:flagellar motor switch protein FliM